MGSGSEPRCGSREGRGSAGSQSMRGRQAAPRDEPWPLCWRRKREGPGGEQQQEEEG